MTRTQDVATSDGREPAAATAAFDEMNLEDGTIRAAYRQLADWLDQTPPETFELKRREADVIFRRLGITFAVYDSGGDPERLIPFDIIPRVLSADEWRHLAAGLLRRIGDDDAYFAKIRNAWSDALNKAYLELPDPDWRA